MEARAAASVQSTGATDRNCRTGGSSDVSAARRAGRDVIAFEVRRARSTALSVTVAAEAAAAFRFQDSDLVGAREPVAAAARFAAGAVVVVAAVGAVGLERCDQFRARPR